MTRARSGSATRQGITAKSSFSCTVYVSCVLLFFNFLSGSQDFLSFCGPPILANTVWTALLSVTEILHPPSYSLFKCDIVSTVVVSWKWSLSNFGISRAYRKIMASKFMIIYYRALQSTKMTNCRLQWELALTSAREIIISAAPGEPLFRLEHSWRVRFIMQPYCDTILR